MQAPPLSTRLAHDDSDGYWTRDSTSTINGGEVQRRSCFAAGRIAKIALAIFLVCAVVVATAALCMHFPSASHISYALFGAVGGLASITMIAAGVRHCLNQRQ